MNTNLISRTSWTRISEIVRKRDGETCQYCGEHAQDGEPDHILPLEKGGRDSFDNLVWSCQECNREKQGKTLREWLISVRSHYSKPIQRSKGHRGKIDLATEWLTELFNEQDNISVPDLDQEAFTRGFSDSILNRAKRRVGSEQDFRIVSEKNGKCWSWVRKD